MFPFLKAVKKTARKVRGSRHALRAFRVTAVASMLAAVSVSAQAPLDVRVALIIGNSAYAGNMALVNPANDAKAMADVLRRLGFTVVELRDGNKAQMSAAIAQVSNSLRGKQGVGMLYYAGHGLQLDWRNYMVPVDANLKSAADVPAQTIDLSSVVDIFKAAGNRMNIVVLDACRDNPFGGNTSSGKGLAQLDAPPSTFLAYATAPGNVTEDGDEKSGNGLYTRFLLQELKRPITGIEDVFKRVRLNVRKQSNGRQIPWESTSLEEDFFFNDGVKYTIKPEEAEVLRLQEVQRMAALVNAPAPKLSKEKMRELLYKEEKAAWDLIKTSNNPDDFYSFLQRFPSGGNLSEFAQYRLDQLAKPNISAALGKGQDANFAYSGPRFKVGDVYQFRTTDILTKVRGGITNLIVSGIEGDVVKFTDSSYVATVLSAIIKERGDEYNPPGAGLPAELKVGKKWTGQSSVKVALHGWRESQFQIESKIIAREEVVVPAGVFQTYVVETSFIGNNINIKKKEWIDPRYGVAIKSEEIGRAGGRFFRSDRRELVAIKAERI